MIESSSDLSINIDPEYINSILESEKGRKRHMINKKIEKKIHCQLLGK